ncbi:hypothetical protein vseg_006513 [Gypsophila vaccaria]
MRPLIAILVALCFSSLYLGQCLSRRRLSVPALYVFGDSLVDSGNNNWLNVPFFAKANYKPYGIDFPGNISTGRVTNGKNVPDFIAKFLGLPYPTRVKKPNEPPSLTGYNYASAGCGILPETGPPNCLNITEQVRLFGVTKETVLRPAFADETQLEYHLANSIFFIWVANNDYLLNYFNATSSSSQDYTPEEFADLLTLRLSEKLESLYEMGARKIVVFEGAPFGCIPFSVDANGTCNEGRNGNATLYNTKLGETLQKLSSQLPNSYFSLGKAYDLTIDAINNPANYGLTNVTGSCCKIAVVFGQKLVQCELFGTPCLNRDEYLFWDAAHPTEAGYQVLGEQCISNPAVCTPYTIQQLAHLIIIPSSSSSLHTSA